MTGCPIARGPQGTASGCRKGRRRAVPANLPCSQGVLSKLSLLLRLYSLRSRIAVSQKSRLGAGSDPVCRCKSQRGTGSRLEKRPAPYLKQPYLAASSLSFFPGFS